MAETETITVSYDEELRIHFAVTSWDAKDQVPVEELAGMMRAVAAACPSPSAMPWLINVAYPDFEGTSYSALVWASNRDPKWQTPMSNDLLCWLWQVGAGEDLDELEDRPEN